MSKEKSSWKLKTWANLVFTLEVKNLHVSYIKVRNVSLIVEGCQLDVYMIPDFLHLPLVIGISKSKLLNPLFVIAFW